MNPLLQRLQPYPFERLRQLFQGQQAPAQYPAISLGIGEPRHPTPAFIQQALVDSAKAQGLSSYPTTLGEPRLREAMAQWLARRYRVSVNPGTQILPVTGSREALFSFAQTVIDPGPHPWTPWVICPNPFYQIYEGAALLAGAQPWFVPLEPRNKYLVDWDTVPAEVWQHTQLVFVCSPANPTGAVMPLAHWQRLFELSDQYGFVIASDECYSEIYFRPHAPLGGLEAAAALGRTDWRRLLAFTSLSKRSNVPGMRSGFVAGDAQLVSAFAQYRTYHGCAMSPAVQAASTVAWSDEAHVEDNRAQYRAKFERITPMLQEVLDIDWPEASFYLWAGIPAHVCGGSDSEFARALYAQYNVTVLPGSFLARNVNGHNPGAGRVRMALVAELDECQQAAERIVEFVKTYIASHS